MPTYTINLTGVVLSVNGEVPDGSGNVTITIPPSVNIYNADDVLTGDRTLGLNYSNLSITSDNSSVVYSWRDDEPALTVDSFNNVGVQSNGLISGGVFLSSGGSAGAFSSVSGTGIVVTSVSGISAVIRGAGALIDSGIGVASKDASAILELKSTTQGFLPPKMTTTQRNAIASPANGLIVDDITLNATFRFDGTNWIEL